MKAKRVLATTLAVVMLFGSGCGSAQTADPSSNQAQDQQTAEATGGESTQSGEREKLTIFVDESWWPYDTWEGAVPEEFSNRIGIDVEIIRAADDNQLPLMVSSGEMADIVCSYRYQFMADSEVSYALDELAAQYPDIAWDPDPVTVFVNEAKDDHYYTIGCGFSPDSEYEKYDSVLTEGPGFMVREDILEELGLSINSLEDLDTVFAAVHEAYPEMITTDFNCIHKFGWLMNQMGLKSSGYVENNGQLEWYLRQDGLLDYYKKVNEWYRNGYITTENFAYTSEDDTKEDCVAGKAFANFGYDNHADNFNTAIAANGDDFSFSLITDCVSDDCKVYNTGCGGRGLYITKSCQNVEAAFRFLSYAYSDEGMKLLMWGIEGEDYTVDADGYPTFTYDFQGDNSVLQPRGLKYWGWLVHNAIVTGIAEATSTSQTAEARKNLTPYVYRNPVIGLIRFETDSDEAIIESKITDMVKNQEAAIMTADSEEACEAAFNEMLSLADELGMGTLEDYANEKYPELKAEYDKVVAEN
ncbi:MAG: extracellular solute-binding protein [Lachnospiraceae bacterium]|nr:extracellular solute-binding protein [Lachnospiraceae bacterium]